MGKDLNSERGRNKIKIETSNYSYGNRDNSNCTLPNFSEGNEMFSIYNYSQEDSINEKEIISILDYLIITEKNLQDNEKEKFSQLNEFKSTKEKVEKSHETPFGPKIQFEQIKFDNSFDSLDYDLCFNLHSEIFYSVLNEEAKNEVENSETGAKDTDNFLSSKRMIYKLNCDSPQLPKNLTYRNSPFGEQSGAMTDKYTEKKTFKSNNINSDNSLIIKKNALCCGRKQKKVINNSIFSNIFITKKSTNISSKSLKLNDSLSRWRKKKIQNLNKTDETNLDRKEKVNCRCSIF
jgi:hypothetical protein